MKGYIMPLPHDCKTLVYGRFYYSVFFIYELSEHYML